VSVTWTETATAQLIAARDYLARSSPGYAQAIAARVVARTETLDGQPLSGAEVGEYGDPTFRELYEHPYRIIYEVAGSNVQILAVIHSARRLPRTLR
jgi:plasmid stabilization system protein ParE